MEKPESARSRILGYSRREFFVRSGIALGGIYSVGVEPYHPRVERIKVPVPGLPHEFDGFTILQMNDIHRGPFVTQSKMMRGFKIARTLKPDLVALPGDFVSFDARNAAYVADAIHDLFDPPFGIYASLGNHEYWTDVSTATTAFKKRDLPILKNEHRRISKGGADIYIAGVDDVWSGDPSMNKALAGVPKDAVKILLCHEPDYADEAKYYGIALQLSGHSHGGQVRLPYVPFAVYPPFARKYPVGLQKAENSTLLVYTSRGLGNGLPVRFLCPPEITLLTLSVSERHDAGE